MAVTWYETASPYPGEAAIEPRGTYTEDLVNWSPQYDIFPTGQPYVACPTASATQASPGYYGDCDGLVDEPIELCDAGLLLGSLDRGCARPRALPDRRRCHELE